MEIEFKFEVPAPRLKAVERAMRAAKTTRTHLQARYFDTADGALAAHGAVLRLRKEGTHWVQTAKAVVEGQGPLHRLEDNVTLGAADDGAHGVPDLRRHAGSLVGRLLDKALGQGAAPLVETLATDIWRLARHEQRGDTTVELALDVGRVMGGVSADGTPRVSPVCELELELVEGRVDDLVTLAQAWAQRHGLWFSTLSKAERGQRLMNAKDEGAVRDAVKAAPPRLADKAGGLAVQRAVLAACLAQVLPNASEVAAGNEDEEVVHQLRVGIRRLRTALRELVGLAPSQVPQFDASWAPALTEVFRVLGAQRDNTLLLNAMQPQLQAAGAPAIKLPKRVAKAGDIGDAVRASAFQAALVSLIGFAAPVGNEEVEATDDDPRPPLQKRLRRLHRQVLHDGMCFESLSAEARHRVRKRLKRLRYLAEFASPLFGDKAAARYIAALVPAQDALGEFNDAVTALAVYRKLAKADPHAWFAVGWLGARQDAQARVCRKALARLGKLHGFWKNGQIDRL